MYHLESGANVNATDNCGGTPLHEAAANGAAVSVDITRTLLDAGADVRVTNQSGYPPPLYFACMSGNEALMRLLVDAGADPNRILRIGGKTLFQQRLQDIPECLEEARILLELGAGPDIPNRVGVTARSLVCKMAHKDILLSLFDTHRRSERAQAQLGHPESQTTLTPEL